MMRKPFTGLGLSLAVAVIGLLTACNDRPPVAPTPTAPQGPTGPAPLRLEIVGPRSVAPGETVQFGATGHFDDGSTRDMTREARWFTSPISPPQALTVDSAGRATAHGVGETTLEVRAGSMMSRTEVVVVPAGTFRLAVVVREAGSIFLDAVRVDVLEGRGAGLSTSKLVNAGYVLYGVVGDTLIRVTGRGYKDHIQRLVVTDHLVAEVEMVPSLPRVDLSGTYTLTLTADPTCRDVLPEELRVRRYAALVSQLGPEIHVRLQGADFLASTERGDRFEGRLDASNSLAVFNLASTSYPRYYYQGYLIVPDVMERLGASRYLVVAGGVTTRVSSSTLSGDFNGSIHFIEMAQTVARTIAVCRSPRHSFVLSR